MNKTGVSYLLWLGCFFSLAGLHRLYNGKIATGLLWMFTWGLFGVGQFVDLFLIPDMVDGYNAKLQARNGMINGVPMRQPIVATRVVQPQTPEQAQEKLMMQLLKAAAAKGGKLSVTQGVMATGVGFAEVEAALREMVKTGYVGIDNDPVTGVVTYDFKEL
jgi:TM2 domain-containing membrane protein YozV